MPGSRPRSIQLRGRREGPPVAAGAHRLNLACGKDIRSTAQGWTNMDVAALPGVDVVHDALRLPWPYPDDTFDHVLASHYLEHIPHRLGSDPKDGFVQVMEEIHRVLRPGGLLEVLGPHPRGPLVWVDPTHTRVVEPANFEYFAAATDHDYYSTARFELVREEVSAVGVKADGFLRLGRSRLGLTSHLLLRMPSLHPWLAVPHEMHLILRAVK